MKLNLALTQIRDEIHRATRPRAGAIWRSILLAHQEGTIAGTIALDYALGKLERSPSGEQTLNFASDWLFGIRHGERFFEPSPWIFDEFNWRLREAGLSVVKADRERILLCRKSKNADREIQIIFEPLVTARVFLGSREIFELARSTAEARFDVLLCGAFSAELEARGREK